MWMKNGEEFYFDEPENNDIWEAIVNYMDDEIREKVHARYSPCSRACFLGAYIEEYDWKFEQLLAEEFGIEWCFKEDVIMKKKMLKEKVIFRREYDPYMKMWKYLACFPDYEPEYPGAYINGIPFYLKDENNPDSWVAEPYTGMAYNYYLKTKIIHKKDPVVPTLVAALESMEIQEDNEGFIVVEKVIR